MTDRWRHQLEAWALPPELLAAVEDSPYRWPVTMFRRRNRSARLEAPTPTTAIVTELLGEAGSVLDIGAGAGRASLPLAASGHRVVGVERDPAMAAALRQEAEEAGVDYRVVEGSWPCEVDGPFDVVMAAHVVYDVADLTPFVKAMAAAASTAVVLELTDAHPWVPLAPYYRALHGLQRPSGPTADDLVDAVAEIVGERPRVERWRRAAGSWFESWEEMEEVLGRRLALPADRRHELRPLVEPDVVTAAGRMTVGSSERGMATVWWRASGH